MLEELAERLGITVREKNIDLYDVIHADEAFYTSTPAYSYPCTKINGIPIGTGAMGPMTGKLIDAWSEDVGLNILAQTTRFAARTQDAATSGANPYRFNEMSTSAKSPGQPQTAERIEK